MSRESGPWRVQNENVGETLRLDLHLGRWPRLLLMSQSDIADDTAGQTITKYRPKTEKPKLYKVILLNDDYTPMDFVILVLKRFFRKDDTEATRIMLQVHHNGAGLAGIYPHELAETKVYQVNEFAKGNKHPLKCIMEQEV